MTFTTHSLDYGLTEGRSVLPYQPAHEVFLRLYGYYSHKFFFESKDVSPIYGRFSLMGVDPALRLRGKNDGFEIEALNERGVFYLKAFQDRDFQPYVLLKRSKSKILGVIERSQEVFEESERSKQHNISVGIRVFLKRFSLKTKSFLGLYGAFSYDFVRQFETLPSLLPDNEVQDFDLFLYDTFVFFDLLKEKAELIAIRQKRSELAHVFSTLRKQILQTSPLPKPAYSISDEKFLYTQEEYQDLVKVAQQYAKEGELVEVVFSNVLKARFEGDPMGLYLRYREANPSPYLFYFDLGKDQLVGASPEMMVRVEDGKAQMRPISGTAKRGRDPIEDHENMLALLSDPKERAELDMLIDLGRNDLSRICEPGVTITDYRFVEKYSRVMHTVAHLSGKLKEGFTAFDALIACLNAGTLTGAPKVAAMTMIEKHEKERRGYYGGTVGYLTCSGEMDTGIIIRTAHIREGMLRFQVGATLLYRSVPEKEYQETLSKAQAFLDTFRPSGRGNFCEHFQGRGHEDHVSECPTPMRTKILPFRSAGDVPKDSRPTILMIDNFDSFTFNLVDYFKQLGCRVLVYRNTIDPEIIPALNPDAIVFSPGPSIPKNAGNMMKIIDQYHQRYPMLGVCLGLEAMVECFGGTLRLIDPPVHGEASPILHDGKTLFKDLPQGFMAGRYHSLVGDRIPDCFEISAKTQDLVMGIRHKTLPIEAVQFHPESVLSMKGTNGFLIMRNFLEGYVSKKLDRGCVVRQAHHDIGRPSCQKLVTLSLLKCDFKDDKNDNLFDFLK
ncbi:MAG: chorismate-binding protein, partial [Candidatus Gracilibacteria bacterium]